MMVISAFSRRNGLQLSRRAALWATTALAVACASSPAVAQTADESQAVRNFAQSDQLRSFSIPRQPLAAALSLFSRQSGLQVSQAAGAAGDVTANAVNGSYTPEQALAELLRGTGIDYRIGANRSVLIGPVSLPAEDAGIDADGSTVLPTIVISGSNRWGRLGDADQNYQTAGSVNHISERNIQRFRGSSAGDFLKGTPGVMTGDNRNSGAIDINVRGMQGFGRVPVVIDGAQQQNTVYRGYSGVASRNYVDPDMIGGVTIEKGPSAGVYGVGATGGVAIMRTITADDIISEGKNWGVRVRGGFSTNTSSPPAAGTTGGIYGFESQSYRTACSYRCTVQTLPNPEPSVATYGAPTGMDRPGGLLPTGGNGSVAYAHRWDNFEIVGAYARRKMGNYHAGTRGDVPDIEKSVNRYYLSGDRWVENTVYSLGGLNRYRAGEEVLNTSQDNTSYLAKGKLKLDGGHELELGYMRYESEFGELMPSIILRGDGVVQAPLSNVSVDTYTARYKWDPEENDLINLKANLWHTYTDTQILTPYEFFDIDMSQGYWDIAKRTGVDISNTSVFDTRWGGLTLDYGGSYTYETLAPPDGYNLEAAGVLDALQARDGWRKEASAFVASEWKPFDWLKFNTSLRYTWTHSYDNNPTLVYALGEYLNNEEKNSGFAPIAAVTIEPVRGYQIYARYAEAIRSPGIFESTSGWSVGSNPTLALKPEHSKNWEFGANVLLDDVLTDGDSLRFKAAYFNNRTDDYLTRVNYIAEEDETVGTTAIRNIKYAKWKGVELSAVYDAGWIFAEASGTYYTSMEFCTNDQSWIVENCRPGGVTNGYVQMHVTPKVSGSFMLGGRFFEEKLELGGRVSYVGERPVSTSNAESGGYTAIVEWSPYTLVDLFGSWKFNENASLDFTVDNVTDVYYMDALTLGLMASPGRTFRANLTIKF